jgi:putative endonuclease
LLVIPGLVPGTYELGKASLAAAAPLPATPGSEIMGSRDKPGNDGRWGMAQISAVYMMASRKHGTLYLGVTSELRNRIAQHREGLIPGFTQRYGVKRLVWYEAYESITVAIQRETSLKRYRREWKINLIEQDNPNWDDLFPQLFMEEGPLAHLQPKEPSL